MATLFPDRHFHVGGDEISGADWKANSRVEEFMRTNGLMTLRGARVLLLRPRAEGRGGSRQDRRVAVPTSLKERRTRSVVELTPLGGAAIPPDPDGPTVRGGATVVGAVEAPAGPARAPGALPRAPPAGTGATDGEPGRQATVSVPPGLARRLHRAAVGSAGGARTLGRPGAATAAPWRITGSSPRGPVGERPSCRRRPRPPRGRRRRSRAAGSGHRSGAGCLRSRSWSVRAAAARGGSSGR